MGSCLSCGSAPKLQNYVRVVHLSGYVEDFAYPVSVSEVMASAGKPTKHCVCTAAQLLSAGSKPLQPETQLQPGHVYFLLPYSTLEDDISLSDFAVIVKKLTAIAKSNSHRVNSSRTSAILNQQGSISPRWNSPSKSPERSCGGRPWKPLLDTIREKSFNRSESEAQEKPVETNPVLQKIKVAHKRENTSQLDFVNDLEGNVGRFRFLIA